MKQSWHGNISWHYIFVDPVLRKIAVGSRSAFCSVLFRFVPFRFVPSRFRSLRGGDLKLPDYRDGIRNETRTFLLQRSAFVAFRVSFEMFIQQKSLPLARHGSPSGSKKFYGSVSHA